MAVLTVVGSWQIVNKVTRQSETTSDLFAPRLSSRAVWRLHVVIALANVIIKFSLPSISFNLRCGLYYVRSSKYVSLCGDAISSCR